MAVSPQKQAQLKGNGHYISKNPCRNCGSCLRYSSTRNCVTCQIQRSIDRRTKTPEQHRVFAKKWRAKQRSIHLSGETKASTLVGMASIARCNGQLKMVTPEHPCITCGCIVRYTDVTARCVNTKHHNRE